ncbi:hypothetical protein Tco_1275125 [Tanacetum coccineum]
MVNLGPLTGYVSKWVSLADMAADVAATSAMTWLVGPIVTCAGSRWHTCGDGWPIRAGHMRKTHDPRASSVCQYENKGTCRALRCPPTFLEAS